MNLLVRSIVRFFLAIIYKLSEKTLKLLEIEIGRVQGKGFGGETPDLEVRQIRLLLGRMDEEIIVFDVGAHVGQYTQAVTENIAGAKVYSFEPNTASYATLSKRFRNYPLVNCEKLAFSDKQTEGQLYFDSSGSPLSSLLKRDLRFMGIQSLESEIVRFETLDNYCEINNIIPTILKLDIEGHELAALLGGLKTLPKIHFVQFEFGGANKDSRTYFLDFWNLFTDNEFTLNRISPHKLIKIHAYDELDEHFRTTNFIAVNSRYYS